MIGLSMPHGKVPWQRMEKEVCGKEEPPDEI
jgi:hypothetical protein